MHHDHGFVAADFRDCVNDPLWEIEPRGLPISWKGLRTLCNRSVIQDPPGTADTDEWPEAELVLVRCSDELLEHPDQFFDRFVAFDLFVGMAPENRSPNAGL